MIGLTTSLAAVAGYEQAAGYAIPVDDAFRETVDKLKAGKERTHGLLGITFRRDDGLPVKGVRVRRDLRRRTGAASRYSSRTTSSRRVNDQPIRDGDDLMLTLADCRPAVRRASPGTQRPCLQRQVPLAKFPVHGKTVVTEARSELARALGRLCHRVARDPVTC